MTDVSPPHGYLDFYDDLPNYNAATSAAKRWHRAFKWRNSDTEYERKESVPLWVTKDQHVTLVRLLAESAAVSHAALDACMAVWPGEFTINNDDKTSAKKARAWPYKLVRDFMEQVQEGSRAVGYERGSLMQNLRERAAAYAFTTIRTAVWSGKAPSLPFGKGLPTGLSFRLNLGTQYGKPLQSREDGYLLAGNEIGWLWMAPSDVASLGGPQGLAQALYVEIGHASSRWRMRLVYAQPRMAVQRVA